MKLIASLSSEHTVKKCIIFLLLCSFNLQAKEKLVVKVVNLQDAQSNTIAYFHQLVHDALVATADMGEFEIQQVTFNTAQNRSMRLLNTPGVLDIMHTMKQSDWEKNLIRIPQPLLNGMLGTRAFLIKKENQAKYKSIPEAALKDKVACQGIHWRDSDIMEANGFNVFRVFDFEAMMKMLAIDRCDYFPRGINEIDSDFENFNGKYTEMAIVKSVLFKYSAPMYFYVGKHNQKLANRLTEGFKRLGGDEYIKKAISESSFAGAFEYLKAPNISILKLKTKTNE